MALQLKIWHINHMDSLYDTFRLLPSQSIIQKLIFCFMEDWNLVWNNRRVKVN